MARLNVTGFALVCWLSAAAVDARAQACAPPSSPVVVAPRFFVPVEFGHGAQFVPAAPDLYVASLRVHPAIGIGSRSPFRIGPSGAVRYDGSDVEAFGGGRALVTVARFIDIGGSAIAVHLAGEALVGPNDQRLFGGAVIADVFGALQATVRVARETRNDRTQFEVAAGTDLAFWFTPAPKRPSRAIPDPFPGQTGFLRVLASWTNTNVNALCDPGYEQELEQARGLVDQAARLATVQEVVDLARARGLTTLAQAIEDSMEDAKSDAYAEGVVVPLESDPANQRLFVAAIIAGWRRALGMR